MSNYVAFYNYSPLPPVTANQAFQNVKDEKKQRDELTERCEAQLRYYSGQKGPQKELAYFWSALRRYLVEVGLKIIRCDDDCIPGKKAEDRRLQYHMAIAQQSAMAIAGLVDQRVNLVAGPAILTASSAGAAWIEDENAKRRDVLLRNLGNRMLPPTLDHEAVWEYQALCISRDVTMLLEEQLTLFEETEQDRLARIWADVFNDFLFEIPLIFPKGQIVFYLPWVSLISNKERLTTRDRSTMTLHDIVLRSAAVRKELTDFKPTQISRTYKCLQIAPVQRVITQDRYLRLSFYDDRFLSGHKKAVKEKYTAPNASRLRRHLVARKDVTWVPHESYPIF